MDWIDTEPPPSTEYPYFWSHEYPLDRDTTCICSDGWLPLPDETMIACYVCNHA